MPNRNYKSEKIISFFALALTGIVIFTSLTFFGVYDSRELLGSYCVFPSGFECKDLDVDIDKVSFKLTYKGPKLVDFRIDPLSGKCSSYSSPEVKSGQTMDISLSCSTTAPKGKSYKDKMEIQYLGEKGVVDENAKIKKVVN